MVLVRAIFLVSVGVALFWLVATKSLVAYLTTAAPGLALRIDPTQPDVLVAMADLELNRPAPAASTTSADPAFTRFAFRTAPPGGASTASATDARPIGPAITPEQLTRIRGWMERVLARDPINARAVRILGQIEDAESGNPDAVKRYMKLAASLSIRESLAVYWMMRRSAEEQNHTEAFYYADALVRTRPDLMQAALPVFAWLAQTRAGNPILKAALKNAPPWRGGFFQALASTVTDVRVPLDLMLGIKDGPAPPTSEEVRSYLGFLVGSRNYELAYYSWLQFLSKEELATTGYLSNGSFEREPSGTPFDWSLPRGSGVTVEIASVLERPGQHALGVSFNVGRVEFSGV